MEFEDIINKVGNYGVYQKRKTWGLIFPISFYLSLQLSIVIFEVAVPTYWCHVPGREKTNLTSDQWKRATLPRSQDDPDTFEKCWQYNVSFVGDKIVVDNNDLLPCQSGWEHDETSFIHTVATYHGWLCDQEDYAKHIYSVSTAGNTLGTLILPFIADIYIGRRLIFFVAMGFSCFFNLLLLVASSYWFHLVCRFFGTFGVQTAFQMPYVIVLELIAPEERGFACFLSFVTWTFGMCTTSLLVVLLTHWIHLHTVVTLAGLFLFGYWRFLPESPRWLLTKGRHSECADIVREIARTNGTPEPPKDQLVDELKKIEHKEEELNISQIPRHPHVAFYLVLVVIAGAAIFLVYGCLVINISILPNNEALNFFVMSLFELPSNLVGWGSSQYLGRRTAFIVSFSFSAIFSAAAALSISNRWLLLALAAFIKLFITSSMYVVFLIGAELFPTSIRSFSLGITLVVSLAVCSASPYIVGLEISLQYWLMVGLSLVGLLCSMLVPETLGLPLPQTFEEAENTHKYRSLTSCIHHWNYSKYMPVATEEELVDVCQEKKKEVGGGVGGGGGEKTEG
ncbi:organic cation transporter 1-like isoform X1 [Oratosquilla oratoria]|uniref:organic cation transporter 1-like isoform X1 n=1 Tax=Oratosquilla oratoria TaxID=337810 RepID=UPI003F7583C1